METNTFTRAEITVKDALGIPAIKCLFNPRELTFTKQNAWEEGKGDGANIPPIKWGAGKAATLTLELHFDTSFPEDQKGNALQKREDVRDRYTNVLWSLMLVQEKLKDKSHPKGRPPIVNFVWGSTRSFDAVITSMTQKFTLFDYDGTPLRAVVNLTLQQATDETLMPRQNPTSGGRGGERLWTVSDGDTLAWIAYTEYGNANKWRQIAEANNLIRVRDLVPGTVLVIP
jgi:hypothetical protein